MKKIKVLVFTLIVFLMSINVVGAACTSEESNKLNSLAVNVKVNYEIVSEKITDFSSEFNPPDGMSLEELENYPFYEDVANIYIMNLTQDLYVKVHDSVSNNITTYTYEDVKDGVINIKQKDFTKINNYTITVYSSDKTNCKDTKLYTTYVTIPKYNDLSEYVICEDIPEFYLCHEYTSVQTTDFDDFISKANTYISNKNKNNNEDDNKDVVKGFFEENKVTIIMAVLAIVVIGGATTVIIVKRQRSRIV